MAIHSSKQAMNQGYEVVETIMGRAIEPVDEPLIKAKLKDWKPQETVSNTIDLILNTLPLFKEMSKLQMRELLLDSRIFKPNKGAVIFKKLDYTNTFYSLIEGTVEILLEEDNGKTRKIPLNKGAFFGEMGLLSGRRRTATVIAGPNCVLMETPRNSMLRLISAVDSVRAQIDNWFIKNAISTYIGPSLSPEAVTELIESGIEKRKYHNE